MRTKPLILALCLCLAGCDTVVPKAVEVHHASIGAAGIANSGLVARLPGGAGYQIDATLRARYNALIARYGHEPLFQPPLVPDQGVTQDNDGNLTMDREAVRRMALLNSWRRSGRVPTPAAGLLKRIFDTP